MRMKLALTLGFAAVAAIGAAYAAVGPTGPGQEYVYRNDKGDIVGAAKIDCDNVAHSWGLRTKNYSENLMICTPDP